MHITVKETQPWNAPTSIVSRLTTQLKRLRTLQGTNRANFKNPAVQQLVAQHMFQLPQMNHLLNNITGRRETLATILIGDKTTTCNLTLAND